MENNGYLRDEARDEVSGDEARDQVSGEAQGIN